MYERKIRDLIKMCEGYNIKHFLTNPQKLYTNISGKGKYEKVTFALNDDIQGDYLYIAVMEHDDFCLLKRFEKEEMSEVEEQIKRFEENMFVNGQWIIFKNQVIYKSK